VSQYEYHDWYWDEKMDEAYWDTVARELAQQIREQALVTLGAKLKKLQQEALK
jgi:hypothetical protein